MLHVDNIFFPAVLLTMHLETYV